MKRCRLVLNAIRATQPLRAIGAALVLLCLALPLGTCSYHVDAAGQPIGVENPNQLPEGVELVRQWSFALEGFPTDTLAWLGLLALCWPAVAAVLLTWRPRGRFALAVRVLELPLMAFSIALVDFFSTFFVSRAIGAYVAFVGAGIYCLGAVTEDYRASRDWLRQKRSASATTGTG
jgi:hypothetical protein